MEIEQRTSFSYFKSYSEDVSKGSGVVRENRQVGGNAVIYFLLRHLYRIVCLFCLLTISSSIYSAEIWVSVNGSDLNPGTKEQPKATLNSALRQARELRRLNDPSIKEGIKIQMHGGLYNLSEPIFIRPEDSGTADSPTLIQAVKNEIPVLSGGVQVKGWKKASHAVSGLPAVAAKNVWVTDVPVANGNSIEFRQMWVNGVKAIRARDVNDDNLPRIISWDKKNRKMGIPAAWVERFVKNEKVFQQPESMELMIHQMWAIANLRISKMERSGDEILVSFQEPEARIQAEHPWPTPMTKDSVVSPFYLSNAIEFLDQPGEWYLDSKNNKLYYWPRKGENLKKAEVIVPVMETLVEASGTLDSPVSYISFEGISFEYTTWMRPSLQGHVPIQAGMYLLDAYKLRPPGVPGNQNKGLENQAWIGRPSAAVQLRGVNHTGFESCNFQHIGSCGLDYIWGTNKDTIRGCIFRDIAGNGIQAGRFSDPGMETHLPYDPADEREICTSLTISNNYITDVTNEDWGCVGIAAGFVRDINIEHNEISEVSYTGISLGWGWTKTVNCMRDNKVHANYIHHYAKHMYDVAGIYTLSAQPKTFITENVVDSIYHPAYVHDPHHWFYLYTDEGSSFITIKDNWCPAEKFLKNANGPGNTWENNGPMVSDSIRIKAGLETKYKPLLNDYGH